jgi:hypothetical protein
VRAMTFFRPRDASLAFLQRAAQVDSWPDWKRGKDSPMEAIVKTPMKLAEESIRADERAKIAKWLANELDGKLNVFVLLRVIGQLNGM